MKLVEPIYSNNFILSSSHWQHEVIIGNMKSFNSSCIYKQKSIYSSDPGYSQGLLCFYSFKINKSVNRPKNPCIRDLTRYIVHSTATEL